jgi:hypothetical protein
MKGVTSVASGLALLLLFSVGCTPNQAADSVIALAKRPRVIPTGVRIFKDVNGTVGFAVAVRNQGAEDTTQPFLVKMSVTVFGLPPAGSAPLFKEDVSGYPGASQPVPGHHFAAPVGPEVTDDHQIVASLPLDPNAVYHVRVVVDEDEAVFLGANVPNFFDWEGRIKP